VAVKVTDDVLTQCDLCAQQCDSYTNCVNMQCNAHYISCNDCVARTDNTCSDRCAQLVAQGIVRKRIPFDKAPEQCVLKK
jgi:UPF0176 protein